MNEGSLVANAVQTTGKRGVARGRRGPGAVPLGGTARRGAGDAAGGDEDTAGGPRQQRSDERPREPAGGAEPRLWPPGGAAELRNAAA